MRLEGLARLVGVEADLDRELDEEVSTVQRDVERDLDDVRRSVIRQLRRELDARLP